MSSKPFNLSNASAKNTRSSVFVVGFDIFNTSCLYHHCVGKFVCSLALQLDYSASATATAAVDLGFPGLARWP